jgi:hypothetical protein
MPFQIIRKAIADAIAGSSGPKPRIGSSRAVRVLSAALFRHGQPVPER